MNYTGYKFQFTTAVHFGKNHLDDSEITVNADTLFSALCHEAVMNGSLDELINAVNKGELRISDAFPYYENTYYVPKPMLPVIREEDYGSEIRKKVKKMEYIPSDKVELYLKGKLNIEAESEKLSCIGIHEVRTMVSIMENRDAEPYTVGAFRFASNCGLYVIIAYDNDEVLYLIEELLINLQYSGLGGKRNSGLGKFVLHNADISESFADSLKCGADEPEKSERKYMSLSVSMCADEEIDNICDNSRFLLIRRSGFVSSPDYSEIFLKKKDVYFFKSGSVFEKRFEGTIKDVSAGGKHPVYRYAFPVFVEVPEI